MLFPIAHAQWLVCASLLFQFLHVDALRTITEEIKSNAYLGKCWNRIVKAFANSLDPDVTPKNMASHQNPNCLLF
ncbi:hypothetical protein DPMN_077613 [Dreissena polymorpha]|uniref:Secreted protein n=1 Tax=Dreissena polymorpha TaxID=45954 RepID=A0A9D4BNG7_DREPO|nr:hypothetical protein DPMN_077613 [Dreissena polymorpha]